MVCVKPPLLLIRLNPLGPVCLGGYFLCGPYDNYQHAGKNQRGKTCQAVKDDSGHWSRPSMFASGSSFQMRVWLSPSLRATILTPSFWAAKRKPLTLVLGTSTLSPCFMRSSWVDGPAGMGGRLVIEHGLQRSAAFGGEFIGVVLRFPKIVALG